LTHAQHDYRVLQPWQITDPNRNVLEFQLSPAGFLIAQFYRGLNGDGDVKNPSLAMQYDLLAFEHTRQPICVRTIRRVHHDSETDVVAEERDATIESVEYSDGFGRVLQKRVEAEDTLFGDAVFGNTVLPPDQSTPITAVTGRTRQS